MFTIRFPTVMSSSTQVSDQRDDILLPSIACVSVTAQEPIGSTFSAAYAEPCRLASAIGMFGG